MEIIWLKAMSGPSFGRSPVMQKSLIEVSEQLILDNKVLHKCSSVKLNLIASPVFKKAVSRLIN